MRTRTESIQNSSDGGQWKTEWCWGKEKNKKQR